MGCSTFYENLENWFSTVRHPIQEALSRKAADSLEPHKLHVDETEKSEARETKNQLYTKTKALRVEIVKAKIIRKKIARKMIQLKYLNKIE